VANGKLTGKIGWPLERFTNIYVAHPVIKLSIDTETTLASKARG